MGIVIAATLILWMFASGWLPARLLLPVRLQTPLTVGVVAAALGPGLVTLPALWTILAWPGGPAFEVAVLSTFIVTVGIWMRRAPARQQVAWSRGQIAGTSQPLARLGLAITGAVACGIVFNAVSWPFPEGDALALYGPYGKFLYESRSLPVGDRLHEAYPMLVPMAYAFAHWATGGVNEYVARLVPAVRAPSPQRPRSVNRSAHVEPGSSPLSSSRRLRRSAAGPRPDTPTFPRHSSSP
jgi:hypothetical protein